MRLAFKFLTPLGVGAGLLLPGPAPAIAGGSAEHALLIIDPRRLDSMQVGNHYRKVRNIPDSNVVYLDPGAIDYATFAARNIPAVLGRMQANGIADHIDYIVIADPGQFYVPASGLISDGCSQVTRFSLSGAYATMLQSQRVLAHLPVTTANHYYSSSNTSPTAFSASTGWSFGEPTSVVDAPRYLIGAVLGYSGPFGNSVAETIAMIDRSAAVDGTLPTGTTFLIQTPDILRSGPRQNAMPGIVSAINGVGGSAELLTGVWMPTGRTDCLGIMTGFAAAGIDSINFGMLPGGFADHLTSYAAMFDNPFQDKVSSWIRKGASGSWGTVEEPCAYAGKFPHARMHLFYRQGLSLGEAVARSVSYMPFQGLLYGDPLTRPFSRLPTVNVTGIAGEVVSGVVIATPSAVATAPGATIERVDLLINGVRVDSGFSGDSFAIDTTRLPNGWNDVRFLAIDDTPMKNVGRWVGSLTVRNGSATLAELQVSPAGGDLSTAFAFQVTSLPPFAQEVRLRQGGRVVAAKPTSVADPLVVYGSTLGAGPVEVFAEIVYADESGAAANRILRTPLRPISIAATGLQPTNDPPTAFSYTVHVRSLAPNVIDMPATTSGDPASLSYEITGYPLHSTVQQGGATPQAVLQPIPGVRDGFTDSMRFSVATPGGATAEGTLHIVYEPCVGDVDGNRMIELADLAILLQNYGSSGAVQRAEGDLNGDAAIDLTDLTLLVSSYMQPCE